MKVKRGVSKMKNLILALMVGFGFSHAALGLQIGEAMPEWSAPLLNVTDSVVSLNAAKREKGLLVIFTCNHCPFSKAWEARYTEYGNELLAKGIGVIAVNSNDPEVTPQDGYPQMRAKHKRLGMKFPYVVDATSDMARAFGATRTPEFFLFNAEGKLVYHGAFDDNAEKPKAVKAKFLADAVNAYLALQPIAKTQTKSVGCSIKLRKPKK